MSVPVWKWQAWLLSCCHPGTCHTLTVLVTEVKKAASGFNIIEIHACNRYKSWGKSIVHKSCPIQLVKKIGKAMNNANQYLTLTIRFYKRYSSIMLSNGPKTQQRVLTFPLTLQQELQCFLPTDICTKNLALCPYRSHYLHIGWHYRPIVVSHCVLHPSPAYSRNRNRWAAAHSLASPIYDNAKTWTSSKLPYNKVPCNQPGNDNQIQPWGQRTGCGCRNWFAVVFVEFVQHEGQHCIGGRSCIHQRHTHSADPRNRTQVKPAKYRQLTDNSKSI